MKMKHLPLAGLAAVATTLTLAGCAGGGNSYSGSGTLQMAAGDLDSTLVYANVDETKEADGTYSNPLYIGSSSYPEFALSHYVRQGTFVGGLTATNQKDTLTVDNLNYSAITGRGAASNATYFVADLNKTASITFRTDALYGVALTPQFIYVTNAAYTYLVMEQGTEQYPAYTVGDYLTLHIAALNKNGGATGQEVEVDLARGGKLLRKWQKVDLTELGECYGLYFTLEATGGTTGLNIPLPPRFCVDLLTANYSYSFEY
jgi:hypothetical protein